jgi:hypothetical protein
MRQYDNMPMCQLKKKKKKNKKNEINEWDDIHLRCLKGNNILAVGNAHGK